MLEKSVTPGEKKTDELKSNDKTIDYDKLKQLLKEHNLNSDLIDNELFNDRVKNFKKYLNEFLMNEYPEVFTCEKDLTEFYEIIKECKGHISGSVILAVIYNDRSLCNDIDIFINTSMFNHYMIGKISKNLAQGKEQVIPEKLEFNELKEFYSKLSKWFWTEGFLSKQHIIRQKKQQQSIDNKLEELEDELEEKSVEEVIMDDYYYYEFAKMNDNQYFSVIDYSLTNKPKGILTQIKGTTHKIENKIPFQVILNIKNITQSEAHGNKHIWDTINTFDIDICANYFDGIKLIMKNKNSIANKWYNYTKADDKSINVKMSKDAVFRKFYTRNLKYTHRNLIGFCNVSDDAEKKQVKEKFSKYLNETEFDFPFIYNKELDVYLYKLSYYEKMVFETDDLVKNRDTISNKDVDRNIGEIYRKFKNGKKIMLVY